SAPAFMDRKKIILAVGSRRGPKVNAVTEALDTLANALGSEDQFEVVGVEVESGVSHTPVTRKELMRGARQRAEALMLLSRETGEAWHYFIGLEGGLDVIPDVANRRVFLESWAYVTDGVSGHYGRSGGIELPEALADEVLENGVELAVAIDKFAGAVGVRDAQGAWGVLSSNFITRQDAFRVAVIAAFAPFYNEKMYRASKVAGSEL